MKTQGAINSTNAAVVRLLQVIREYESDTFSADGSGLKDYEAEQIAAHLIDGIEEHLDGVRLSAILDDVVRDGR